MKFYPIYEQKKWAEVEDLIRTSQTCNLITLTENGLPEVGVFNPIYANQKFFLHLNRSDQQIAQLKKVNYAKIVFQDILAMIPSYFVDPDDASVATTYYRYAELECTAKIYEEPKDMIMAMKSMMEHYQPEKQYEDLKHDSEMYADTLKTIAVIEFKIERSKAKWKIGQNRTPAQREVILGHLKKRGLPGDLRAIEEIKKFT